MKTTRINRVNSEIQKHLAEIIARFDDSEISGSLITILKLEPYADFSMTKVYISVFGDAEKNIKMPQNSMKTKKQ